MNDRAREVADALLGTANDLENEASEEEINSISFCDALDELVMQCETCNWWVAADDVDDDGNCAECW